MTAKKIRWLATLVILTLGMTAGVAGAAEKSIAQPVIVNGAMTDDATYQSVDHLKSVKKLENGTERVLDYANGIVLDLPAGSGYNLDKNSSVLDTVLNNGKVLCTLSREVFPEDEVSTDFIAAQNMALAEQYPESVSDVAYKGANSWQMLRWQEGDNYHFQGTADMADSNEVYQIHLQSAQPITIEDADQILDNFQVMSSSQLVTYLDFYPVADIKKIIPKGTNAKQLVDYANGYSFNFPQDMVVDASQGDLRTVLSNNECQIEIYRQPLDQTVTGSVYKTYSNYFLDNSTDHQLQYRGNHKIAGMKAQVLQWNRDKLTQVNNDKNYYLCVDLVRNNQVAYTVFIKANRDVSADEKYLQVLSSFKLIKPIGEVAKGNFFTTTTPDKEAAKTPAKPTRYEQWNDETKKLYDAYFSPQSKLTWGIFEPSAPESFYMLKPLEQKLDHKFKFLIQYQHLPSDNALSDLTKILNNAYSEQRTVELTLQTTGYTEETGNVVYDVLNGEYDAFLEQYAKKLADFKHPVLFRLDNEMNGDWCQYSSFHTAKDTDMYKELYRHVFNIFEKQGANKNVLWVWNPNEISFPNFSWNNAVMYYPGNNYVDIVGMTGYNTGNYYEGEVWRTFDQIYQPLYKDYTTRFDKPLMITEFGSNSVGGDKELWVKQMFSSISRMDKIKVAIWWSGCDWESPGVPARIYYMDETPQLVDIFKLHFSAGKTVKAEGSTTSK